MYQAIMVFKPFLTNVIITKAEKYSSRVSILILVWKLIKPSRLGLTGMEKSYQLDQV